MTTTKKTAKGKNTKPGFSGIGSREIPNTLAADFDGAADVVGKMPHGNEKIALTNALGNLYGNVYGFQKRIEWLSTVFSAPVQA